MPKWKSIKNNKPPICKAALICYLDSFKKPQFAMAFIDYDGDWINNHTGERVEECHRVVTHFMFPSVPGDL